MIVSYCWTMCNYLQMPEFIAVNNHSQSNLPEFMFDTNYEIYVQTVILFMLASKSLH